MVEVELTARLDAGRVQEAVTLGLQAYGGALKSSIGFVVRNDVDAADAYGAFLEDLWKSIHGERWQRRCSFASWARRLAYHAALRQVGKRRWQNVTLSSALHPPVATVTGAGITDVGGALDQLSAQERALVWARLWDGLKWKQIAILFGHGTPMSEEELTRAATRHRVTYQRLKTKLRQSMPARESTSH